MAQTPPRRVLWAANVRTKSLDERLAAAREGSFDAMSVFPIDFKTWQTQMSDAEISARIRDGGIDAAILDPYVQWVPNFAIPEGYPADYISFIDHTEDDLLRMAEVLGVRQVNCVEGLNQPYERSALVDAMGAFAERMGARGFGLTLEPMPISSIFSLADGWDIVRQVNNPALGLCFDTWHFWRADPDHDLLATIPADKITEVQLADAKTEIMGGDLTTDLLYHRLFAGDGDFDLVTTMQVLRDMGAVRSIGPERFSAVMDGLDALEAGRQAGANLTQWV